MSTIEQNNSESFEERNASLQRKLKDFDGVMTVKLSGGKKYRVTLLQIYTEWVNFLEKKKEKEKNRNNHLIDQWKDFVVVHDLDVTVKLLMAFFRKKRDYMIFQENGVREREYWSGEDISANLGLYQDKDLINRLFPSYSATEVRIRKQFERGILFEGYSDNLAETLNNSKKEKKGATSGRSTNIEDFSQAKTEDRTGVQLEIEFPGEKPSKSEQKPSKPEQKNQESIQDKKTEIPSNNSSDSNLDDWYDDEDGGYYQYPWQRRNNR